MGYVPATRTGLPRWVRTAGAGRLAPRAPRTVRTRHAYQPWAFGTYRAPWRPRCPACGRRPASSRSPPRSAPGSAASSATAAAAAGAAAWCATMPPARRSSSTSREAGSSRPPRAELEHKSQEARLRRSMNLTSDSVRCYSCAYGRAVACNLTAAPSALLNPRRNFQLRVLVARALSGGFPPLGLCSCARRGRWSCCFLCSPASPPCTHCHRSGGALRRWSRARQHVAG